MGLDPQKKNTSEVESFFSILKKRYAALLPILIAALVIGLLRPYFLQPHEPSKRASQQDAALITSVQLESKPSDRQAAAPSALKAVTKEKATAERLGQKNQSQSAVPDFVLDPRVQEAYFQVSEDGEYREVAEVAAYLCRFGHLPKNYRSKQEQARDPKGKTPQGQTYMIGGNRFFNREKILPTDAGILYYECDLHDPADRRGAWRLVFTEDGRIYETRDHYQTFSEIVAAQEGFSFRAKDQGEDRIWPESAPCGPCKD